MNASTPRARPSSKRGARALPLSARALAEAASTANRHLGDLYGLLMRLDGGTTHQGESLEAAWESMNQLWDLLWTLRHLMRVDLGITAPDQEL